MNLQGKDRAYWLADKIPAHGDYAKEAAIVLRQQADHIEALEQRVKELEDFQLACTKRLYEMLGVDDSDGEYRFKWAALELSNKLQELATLRQQLAEKDAECEGFREDAERLDWFGREFDIPRLLHRHYKDDLRTAIDAARNGGE